MLGAPNARKHCADDRDSFANNILACVPSAKSTAFNSDLFGILSAYGVTCSSCRETTLDNGVTGDQ